MSNNVCPKYVLPCQILLLLFLYLGIAIADDNSTDSDPAAGIQLIPGSPTYTYKEAADGRVHFMAEIANKTDGVLVIAHPLVCFPEGYKHGDQYSLDQRHNLAEILLFVKQPSGKQVILRQGGDKYFEPGNMDYFYILPKSSKYFYIGWFSPNSRGRWEDNNTAEKVFADLGTYEVSLLYRNLLPYAAVRTDPMKKAEFIKPWRGELSSETITFKVK